MSELKGAEINVSWYVASYLSTLPIGATTTRDEVAGKLPVEADAELDVIGAALSFQMRAGAIKSVGTAQSKNGRGLAVYEIVKPIVPGEKSRRPSFRTRTNGNGHDPAPQLPLPVRTGAEPPSKVASDLLAIAARVETMERDLIKTIPTEVLMAEVARRMK